ncbi:MAG: MtnX-like HAD-IB family phosphatase [Candidatus Levybacteria bacterium]|nr:MtnX-like HAD-IB family phosphatase [Candidatus Levybacteria bacterium]
MTTKQNKNVSCRDFQTAIVCDFDGTITLQDVTDEILNKFGDSSWHNIGELYSNGDIPHAEMNKRFVSLLLTTPTKLKNFLKETIQLRDGFTDFVNLCRKSNTPLIIISSGWDFYIKFSIKEAVFINNLDEISTRKMDSIPVISNNIFYNKTNYKWYLKLPWSSHSCEISSPCKGNITKLLREKGFNNIISIGNSETDICMAQESDLVFATGSLVDVCLKKSITFQRFQSFAEINKVLFISR